MSPEPIDLEAIERLARADGNDFAEAMTADVALVLVAEVRRLRAEVESGATTFLRHAQLWQSDLGAMAQERDAARAELDATKARGLDTIALYARERDEARSEADRLADARRERDALKAQLDQVALCRKGQHPFPPVRQEFPEKNHYREVCGACGALSGSAGVLDVEKWHAALRARDEDDEEDEEGCEHGTLEWSDPQGRYVCDECGLVMRGVR